MVASLEITPAKRSSTKTPSQSSLLENVPTWFLKAYYTLEAKGEYQEPITVLKPGTITLIREDLTNKCRVEEKLTQYAEYTAVIIGEAYQKFGPHKAGEAWQYLIELNKAALAKDRVREKAWAIKEYKLASVRDHVVTMRSLRHHFIFNWNQFNYGGLYNGWNEIGAGSQLPDYFAGMLIGWLLVEQPDALFTLSIRQAWQLIKPKAENMVKLYQLNQKYGKDRSRYE